MIENSTHTSKVIFERENDDNRDVLIELHRSKHCVAPGETCPALLATVTVSFTVIIGYRKCEIFRRNLMEMNRFSLYYRSAKRLLIESTKLIFISSCHVIF